MDINCWLSEIAHNNIKFYIRLNWIGKLWQMAAIFQKAWIACRSTCKGTICCMTNNLPRTCLMKIQLILTKVFLTWDYHWSSQVSHDGSVTSYVCVIIWFFYYHLWYHTRCFSHLIHTCPQCSCSGTGMWCYHLSADYRYLHSGKGRGCMILGRDRRCDKKRKVYFD